VVCLGHWFNKFGLRVSFGDASSRRRRSALARRRLPFLRVGFYFQRLVLLSVVRQLPERWPDLGTILSFFVSFWSDRQLIPINTDFWRA